MTNVVSLIHLFFIFRRGGSGGGGVPPGFGGQTKAELHAVEKSLVEEKHKILTESEALRRAAEELRAANRQLLSSLDRPKAPVADANAATALEPHLPVSRQSVSKKFLLPDLNELPDCLD
ncbi:hypothetical protein MUK42_10557 [Musa troglodytarum]|uniref:Uncharacterized protein n=1 Tax=Musa troglodytarum TaxID=320322 RepID=A0A9E7GNA9_9LILI|nr:hypothetical protein MUK42_10557 [Musa troglodytarum]